MTYIDYLNQFWRLFRTEPCSIPESALYFFLLHVANGNMWYDHWECSNEYILSKLDMSRSTLKRAKKSLKEKGLIDYTSPIGRGNTCVYRLLEKGSQKTLLDEKGFTENPFSAEKGSQNGSDLNPFSKEKEKVIKEKEASPIACKDIDRENKERNLSHDNKSIIILGDPPLTAPVPIADILLKVRTTEQQWIETFCMNNQITLRDFNIMSDLFIQELENRNIKSKTIADYQHHFASWFAIQKNKRNEQRTNNRLEQKREIAIATASDIATKLAQADADYLRAQAGGDAQADVQTAEPTDSRLLANDGEYPFK